MYSSLLRICDLVDSPVVRILGTSIDISNTSFLPSELCFVTSVMTSNSAYLSRVLPTDLSQVLIIAFLCVLPISYYLVLGGPLGNIPGPFSARLSRAWMVKHSWQGDMHRTMIGLHKKHGKLVRTGPNELSVSDLSAIKQIYGAGTKFRKSVWYSVWQGHRKFDLFAERDEGVHGMQRRLVSRIYSMESLKHLETYVDDAVSHLLAKMQQRQGQSIDMGLFVQLFAFGQFRIPISTRSCRTRTELSRCYW